MIPSIRIYIASDKKNTEKYKKILVKYFVKKKKKKKKKKKITLIKAKLATIQQKVMI